MARKPVKPTSGARRTAKAIARKRNVKRRSVAKAVPKKKAAARPVAREKASGKAVAGKLAAKKGRAGKTAARKNAAKKRPARIAPARKSPVKKTPVRKAPVKKTPVKKAPAKKSRVGKAVAKAKAGRTTIQRKQAAPGKSVARTTAGKQLAPKAPPAKATRSKPPAPATPLAQKLPEIGQPTGSYSGIFLTNNVKPFPKKTPYGRKELMTLRETLTHEHEQLLRELTSLDNTSREVMDLSKEHPGYSLHMAEHATDLQTAEASLGVRSIVHERLEQVDTALRRLQENPAHYGLCLACGSKIGIQRLLARPHAHLCMNCRQRYEHVRARRG
jgi:RNA polymerase-binding transcription factor DksA